MRHQQEKIAKSEINRFEQEKEITINPSQHNDWIGYSIVFVNNFTSFSIGFLLYFHHKIECEEKTTEKSDTSDCWRGGQIKSELPIPQIII